MLRFASIVPLSMTHHQSKPGGADRDRTGGLLVANQALSQLSYSPTASFKVSRFQSFKVFETLKPATLKPDFLVGLDRLELSTSPLSGVRSSHLSYRPGYFPSINQKDPEPNTFRFVIPSETRNLYYR